MTGSAPHPSSPSRSWGGAFGFGLKRNVLDIYTTPVGETGNAENFIDTRDDPRTVEYLRQTFKPTKHGELYVYWSKPVSGFWLGLFHDVNTETAKVRVVRIPNR